MEYIWQIIIGIVLASAGAGAGYFFSKHKEKNNRQIEVNKKAWANSQEILSATNMGDLHSVEIINSFPRAFFLPIYLIEYTSRNEDTDFIFTNKNLEKRRQLFLDKTDEYFLFVGHNTGRQTGENANTAYSCFYNVNFSYHMQEPEHSKHMENIIKAQNLKTELCDLYIQLDQAVKKL